MPKAFTRPAAASVAEAAGSGKTQLQQRPKGEIK